VIVLNRILFIICAETVKFFFFGKCKIAPASYIIYK
jgi:hypothetical protein